ncbi:hypothetical protein NDU88_001864 [Pleurodeles waltl]|uniref:Uncharacterized protein n=1 Tax=Pleurodeles waltl TaxID=8319 RepID=A0AAV7RCT9_PLEWA|nr:hypothetical protein NDU88_001864 [Pleurodeles waltl]
MPITRAEQREPWRTVKNKMLLLEAVFPSRGWRVDPMRNMQNTKKQTNQPAGKVDCSLAPRVLGQGLQEGLGKMMEEMYGFIASAKAWVGLGMDEQGSSSKQAGASKVWGQNTHSPPKVQGEPSSLVPEDSGMGATDIVSGRSEKEALVRPDSTLPTGKSSLAWRVPLEARERIWNREFINIFLLLIFAKEGTVITVSSKEVDKHKWKVKPQETIDNWLEAFVVLSTVIMKKFPEQGPALCKYNLVI